MLYLVEKVGELVSAACDSARDPACAVAVGLCPDLEPSTTLYVVLHSTASHSLLEGK